MNCANCLKDCKAACCGIIPFEKDFIKRHKPIREVLKTIELDNDLIVLETENFVCPYLNSDYSCSVYKDRTDVCKLYGNETQINLTCQFQDKDGRIRSRQERRKIERQINKFIAKYVKEKTKH